LKAAGSGSVRIAFTGKAKRKLAGAGSVPLTVTVLVTDAAGGKRKLTKAVRLKK
jgi:hypothetical protein